MKSTSLGACALIVLASFALTSRGHVQEAPPAWAYYVNPPDFNPAPDDGSARRVPGSNATYTLTDARNLFRAPDWHPESHPPMPEIVALGRKPSVYACGVCHRADGPGGPENANITGLPADYIIQQLADFKAGLRKSSVPNRAPIALKLKLAAAITDDEIAAAAAYFSLIPYRSMVSVIEADDVPQTRVVSSCLTSAETGRIEPIAGRIIEIPESFADFESRDSNARLLAYVPKGSIETGRNLALTGSNGKTVQCTSCHGERLKGIGLVPRLAGLSPTYVFRQLYDFKNGTRAGAASELMKPTVANLSVEDMVALAAYVGSSKP